MIVSTKSSSLKTPINSEPGEVSPSGQALVDEIEPGRQTSPTGGFPHALVAPKATAGQSSAVAAVPTLPHTGGQVKTATAEHLAKIVGKPSQLVFLLDYDGTLMDNIDPYISTASPELTEHLRALSKQVNVNVIIVSGRDHFYHEKAVPEGLGVHRIANHGADFKRAGEAEWQTLVGESSLEWKTAVKAQMNAFTATHPGTQVEDKTRGVTLHCEQAENFDKTDAEAALLATKLRLDLQTYNLKVEHSAKVVEVRENGVDKGKAAKLVLQALLGDKAKQAVIVAAGDADTDEGMFKALSDDEHAVTIRVGPGNTDARWRVENPAQVRALLNLVARNFESA